MVASRVWTHCTICDSRSRVWRNSEWKLEKLHGQLNSGHRKFQKFCVLFCFNCLLNSRKGLRCNPLSISSAGFHNICFNLYSDFTFRWLALLNTDTAHCWSHSLRCRMLHTVSSDTGRMGPLDHWWPLGTCASVPPVTVFPGLGAGPLAVYRTPVQAPHLYTGPVHVQQPSNIGAMTNHHQLHPRTRYNTGYWW